MDFNAFVSEFYTSHGPSEFAKALRFWVRIYAMLKAESEQHLPKFGAGFGDVRRIENGGDDADAFCAGGQNIAQSLQIDAADGEPWDLHVFIRPANVFERHGFGGRFCAGGENWAYGDVIGVRSEGALGLRGCVS